MNSSCITWNRKYSKFNKELPFPSSSSKIDAVYETKQVEGHNEFRKTPPGVDIPQFSGPWRTDVDTRDKSTEHRIFRSISCP